MRKLVVAVVGAVAITVASSAAYAIGGSAWFGAGRCLAKYKARGQKLVRNEGTFENTGLSVGTSFVSLPVNQIDFSGPAVVTVTAGLGGVFSDVRNLTTRRVTLDNEGSSTQISLLNLVGDLMGPTAVTVTANTNKPPRGEDPIILDPAAGFIVYQDTVDIRGGFTAIKNFTEVTGKITIVFQGVVRLENGDLAPFKGSIVLWFGGIRD